ncbi:DUF3108 domain-containing protein [candidate division KSB1 bacterium]|nr:MAG: DUF3108 domain-containing protein [candidate division KSB1 bacterium]
MEQPMPEQIKFVLFLVLSLLLTGTSAAQTKACSDSLPTDSARVLPFHIGERLVFRLRYGFVKAGVAEMKVLGKKTDGGCEVLHIQSTARSIGSFDWFYKVRDVINVYLDPQTLYPIHFEKLLREGRYMADTYVDYFQQDSLAKVTYIRYKRKNKIRKKEQYSVKIPPGVFDALSVIYYVRTLPLEPGKPVFVTNHEKKKVYTLKILVYPKETITVKAGTFRCVRIEPLLAGEGIFKHEGKLNIWLTDDTLKIPVRLTTKVIVGHIAAELEKIEGVPEPIPARIKR